MLDGQVQFWRDLPVGQVNHCDEKLLVLKQAKLKNIHTHLGHMIGKIYPDSMKSLTYYTHG